MKMIELHPDLQIEQSVLTSLAGPKATPQKQSLLLRRLQALVSLGREMGGTKETPCTEHRMNQIVARAGFEDGQEPPPKPTPCKGLGADPLCWCA